MDDTSLRDWQGRRNGLGQVAHVSHHPAIHVRAATVNDSAVLLEWRNDPSVYRWARQPEPVCRREHDRWLGNSLANPDRLLLIGELGDNPVGVVRLDRLPDRELTAEVSITVAPASHGRGVGRQLLAAAARRWEVAGGRLLIANVHEQNDGSARLFLAAGYRRVSAERPWTTWEFALDSNRRSRT